MAALKPCRQAHPARAVSSLTGRCRVAQALFSEDELGDIFGNFDDGGLSREFELHFAQR